ncbi:2-oxo-tetronate isomerase [Tepidamorphus sp. 3E244]|uniref:2-oxo-tetronate isomerase n=1 Tax=Tepidamorphus sp. 3E244 TaxID=3385498 RepID=UPI0038FC2CEE
MPKFAANLSMLFNELPFKARFSAARMAGFRAVEFLFPYAQDAGLLLTEIETHGLKVVLFNLPPGDWEAGERGIAAIPGREVDFERSVSAAIEYAKVLDCKQLHAMAGIMSPMIDPDIAMSVYMRNLSQAASELKLHDITLLIEPINHRDMPGYFLSRTQQARRVIEAIDADNLKLQFDVYHRQMMEGNLIHGINNNLDIISHIQIANPPQRLDPSAGEINFPYLFQMLDGMGYEGWIGCEYKPLTTTKESLDWFEPYRR